MAVAVRSDRELDRDERLAAPVVEPAAGPLAGPPVDVVDHFLPDDQRQELVHNDPLIVPPDELLRALEQPRATPELVDHRVVELQERELELRDDQVLVVARVSDQRRVDAVAWHVAGSRGVDQQPDAVLGVEVRVGLGPRAVDAVELEQRRAEVLDRLGVVLPLEARGRVERDVVVHELAEEHESDRDCRVVLDWKSR